MTLEIWADNYYTEYRSDITDKLNTNQYDIIFLGNSMLEVNVNNSIITSELSNLTGRKIEPLFISFTGNYFPTWYLVIKNRILTASKEGIPIVIVDLKKSAIEIDITPKQRNKLINLMNGYENRFFGISSDRLTMEEICGKMSHLITNKRSIMSEVRTLFISIVSFNTLNKDDQSISIKNRFTVGEFKEINETKVNNLEPITDLSKIFSDIDDYSNISIEQGFLPEIINITQSKFSLIYVDSSLKNDSTEYKTFRKKLEKFLHSRNVTYIDLNKREELKNNSLYADQAHFKNENGQDIEDSRVSDGIALNSKIIAEELWSKGVIK
jgi:hypothetical protein